LQSRKNEFLFGTPPKEVVAIQKEEGEKGKGGRRKKEDKEDRP
jgi:hypothetical protein